MRFNTPVCPKRCKIDKRERVRLQIISDVVMLTSPSGKKRFLQELNWKCPKCGHIRPVTINDARRQSRYPSSHTVKKQYEGTESEEEDVKP